MAFFHSSDIFQFFASSHYFLTHLCYLKIKIPFTWKKDSITEAWTAQISVSRIVISLSFGYIVTKVYQLL